MRSSSGLTIRDTVSQDDYAPTWDPIGVTFILRKNWLYEQGIDKNHIKYKR